MYSVDDIFKWSFSKPVQLEISRSISLGLLKAKGEAEQDSPIPYKRDYSAKCSVNTFVEEELVEACVRKQLPFEFKEGCVSSNSFKYTVFSSDFLFFHVKKISTISEFPRKASFRENAALSNQLFLFDDLPFRGDCVNRLSFALIVYGHDDFDLTFVGVGFPEYGERRWHSFFDLPLAFTRDVEVFQEKILEDNMPKLKPQFVNGLEKTMGLNEA